MKKIFIAIFFVLLLVACQMKDPLILFDTDGAGEIPPIKLSELKELPTPIKSGFTFKGWYLDLTFEEEFKLTTKVSKDTTLYAKFEVNPTPPIEIVIMHAALEEVDPFHPNYKGKYKTEKQNLQREVETKYNVTITYKTYPSSAMWGPSRISAISEGHHLNKPLADIYSVSSDWISDLSRLDAIASINKYLSTYGRNIDERYVPFVSYRDQIYGFEVSKPKVSKGLFYNIDLLNELNVANPAELYLEGKWTWSEFESWSRVVQNQLSAKGDNYYALGGQPITWAMNMVPLNGGSFLNLDELTVDFVKPNSVETFDFISDLLLDYQVFEPNGTYDAGSDDWLNGRVLIHPGSLHFLNVGNRWLNRSFEMGFVPYPVSNTYTGDYVSFEYGYNVYVIGKSNEEKEELVFKVWNELQYWQTDEALENDLKTSLKKVFDDDLSLEVYMTIYEKTYLDLIDILSDSLYAPNGFITQMNATIKDRTSETKLNEIKEKYTQLIENYKNRL
ncbi:InlB B-repeat-containing protein [Acholeplasma hippikon]|uniref:Maltose-binding periplasmic proteins/domains n=1 Tax=Acholeplasma hippikon TaxID=264636 RepID=A0A449BII5_9MOLU|nr:InlB B-repeat-containing protein [Acholeplasma hippikon]VEU82248.1 Maltose-binding periplasmic proteins/domains [Acholeplasma hippikon]